MTEAELQGAVIDALAMPLRGSHWLLHHDTDPRRSHSHGWPDIYAIHPTTMRTVAVELKTEAGRLRPGQHDWLLALTATLDHTRSCVGIVRPSDLTEVLTWIAQPATTPPPLPLI